MLFTVSSIFTLAGSHGFGYMVTNLRERTKYGSVSLKPFVSIRIRWSQFETHITYLSNVLEKTGRTSEPMSDRTKERKYATLKTMFVKF